MTPELIAQLEEVKKSLIIIDIETSAVFPDTQQPIDITSDFENYVKYAKVKWIGMYSYDGGVTIVDTVVQNEDNIREFIGKHKGIIGFNTTEFDLPILFNNKLIPEGMFYIDIDMMVILGAMSYQSKSGQKFKNRGSYMGYKFPRNSLRVMAQTMGCQTAKGEIDYKIFYKDSWKDEECNQIRQYLEADVLATKEMFDKTWNFWLPFCEFLTDKNVLNLSWIRSSIASLTYKAACKVLDCEETYAEKEQEESETEEMGGLVRRPIYEEARNVWYVDVVSMYPHIFSMFNLFAEVEPFTLDSWHGNDIFQVKGWYDITKHHKLSEHVAKLLQQRIDLKKELKENPQKAEELEPKIYTIKLFLNSLYGAARSKLFEQIHTENCGWDCCWIGQQMNEYISKRMGEFGYQTVAGDTDSLFLLADITHPEYNEKDYITKCLKIVVEEIKAKTPFPAKTFDIGIEAYIEYIMWPFSKEPIEDINGNTVKVNNRIQYEWRAKKKNYCYIKHGSNELKVMGMSIKKDDATPLGVKIFHEIIEPRIIQVKRAKFEKSFINGVLEDYLKKPESLELLARQYKVKPANTYKMAGQIQKQISEGYFGGQDGVISLIKTNIPGDSTNKKFRPVGRAGKGTQYCTVEEAKSNNLQINELDLEKIQNELEPFIERIA